MVRIEQFSACSWTLIVINIFQKVLKMWVLDGFYGGVRVDVAPCWKKLELGKNSMNLQSKTQEKFQRSYRRTDPYSPSNGYN